MGLGSEIRDPDKTIPYPGPGVKKAPDPGSGSATLILGMKNFLFVHLLRCGKTFLYAGFSY